MLSINQATQVLHIGKPRLYRLMKKCEISPVPDGHRKILTEDQIEILKEVIASSYSKVVSTNTKTSDELGTSSVQTGDELGTSRYKLVMNQIKQIKLVTTKLPMNHIANC